MSKANPGNYFEDFALGQEIHHATPRTLTEGDVALYAALYGGRFELACNDEFARRAGFKRAPIDDLLVFHIVFGKSVPDISINAVANLGYAEGRFGVPVYPGDTLSASSTVIGLKENSNRKTGIVYVRTKGINQRGETVLEFVRWVMVRKRDEASPAPDPVVPSTADHLADLAAGIDFSGFEGSGHHWEDYAAGEEIDHVDGMTIEEAEHMMATRLYQNSAKVHFDQHQFGRRLIYGGHIISLARALSFNGLGNAVKLAAINGGRHIAPTYGGDTIYAKSRVIETWPLRKDVGALRIETNAFKNGEEQVLSFDYTVLAPRRP
jgi:2-methylfumaryl-CoA hydratase